MSYMLLRVNLYHSKALDLLAFLDSDVICSNGCYSVLFLFTQLRLAVLLDISNFGVSTLCQLSPFLDVLANDAFTTKASLAM